MATVFLGFRMDAAGLDDSPLYAMIVYCVGVAFVILFDFYISLEKSDKKKEIFSLAKEENSGKLTRLSSSSIVIDNTRCQASPVTSLHLGFTFINRCCLEKSEYKTRCIYVLYFTTGGHDKREQSVDKVGVEFY